MKHLVNFTCRICQQVSDLVLLSLLLSKLWIVFWANRNSKTIGLKLLNVKFM
jgi:hypothetical protein